MIKFRPGVEVVTKEPFVVVAPGLELGSHRFQLVVVDDRGRRSRPTFHYILLYKRERPALKKDSGKEKKPKPPAQPKKAAGTEKKRKPATQPKKDPNKSKKPRKKI